MKRIPLLIVVLAAASLLACGKSEESVVVPLAQEAPQQTEAQPMASVAPEPALSGASTAQVDVAPASSFAAHPALQTASAPVSADGPATAKPDHARGQQIYRQACAFCHDKGVAGAPRTGDAAAWSPRLAQGMDTLYASALHGKNAMPAKGGNASLTDADVKATVDFMAAQSR